MGETGRADDSGATLELTLERDREGIALVDAPREELRGLLYPNADDVDQMVVRVDAAGAIAASCTYEARPTWCRAHPFHTRHTRDAIEVWDLYGNMIARTTSATAGDPDAPTPDGSPTGVSDGTSPDADERPDRVGETTASEYAGSVSPIVHYVRGELGGASLGSFADLSARGNQSSGLYSLEIGHGPDPFTIGDEAEDGDGDRGAEDGDLGAEGARGADLYLRLHLDRRPTSPDREGDFGEGGRSHVNATVLGTSRYADERGVHASLGIVLRSDVMDDEASRVRTVDVEAVWQNGDWLQVRLAWRLDDGTNLGVPATSVPPPAPSWNEFADGCVSPDAKTVFCGALNRELSALGVTTYSLDCTTLPDHPTTIERAVVVESGRLIDGCNLALRPASDATGDLVDGSYTAEQVVCQRVLTGTWVEAGRQDMRANGVCSGSPILLDLSGDGISLSAPDEGTAFDLLGTGDAVQTAWPVSDDDAFLVIDLDDDGVVSGARELFGNFTGGNSYANGFEPLAALDENGDGRLDADDPAFASLRVWRDTDRNGVSAPAELTTVRAAGIASFDVTPASVPRHESLDEHGNSMPLVGRFTFQNGEPGHMADAFLRYRTLASESAPTRAIPQSDLCVGIDVTAF
jgi:hypothetical protein